MRESGALKRVELCSREMYGVLNLGSGTEQSKLVWID